MTFDEQDSLIESLNAAYDKAGTITDEDIKELFAKKNAIADEDEQTSYEFDEFFAEVVSKWAQDGLTDEKAQLLLNLIDSADGSVDDSEDAMLEELSMAELTGALDVLVVTFVTGMMTVLWRVDVHFTKT